MNEGLKDLLEMIDTLEDELWRQGEMSVDPKLEEWMDTTAKTIGTLKAELETYIEKTEEAGTYL